MPIRISKNRVSLENIPLNLAPEVDVASASTTNIGSATSNNVRITGTTTITAFDSASSGVIRFIRFASALTLTHNATSLKLPGSANITTAADDRLIARSLGSGNWEVFDYTKASGTAIVGATPAGAVMYFAMSTPPNGWLECNGSAVSRTTYATLFSAISTTFGSGDGATTFNLPDLRGEFLRGWDDGRGVDSARVFGSAQADGLKAHTHSGVVVNAASGAYYTASTAQPMELNSGSTATTGGSETRPRNIALLPCIKY